MTAAAWFPSPASVLFGGDPEIDRERDEPLLRAVVQVAFDPPALVGRGGLDPLA